ncbi:hypothetical protein [Allostreptomyces psammosilenae]|uniref:hypothetical protein n=1 Tax=Allostreptomyces psammosilenae TaxID=1892865 RepID=UPI0028AE0B86|nr:hypothetical protein [Allostreptomyces psammosilenae]
MLVPRLAGAAAVETEDLRKACGEAIAAVLATHPDRLVVVGPADPTGPTGHTQPVEAGEPRAYPAGTRGDFARYGVPMEVVLPGRRVEPAPGMPAAPRTADDRLPSSLTVAAHLLETLVDGGAELRVACAAVALDPRTPAEVLLREVGPALAAGDERVALLVVGEGSICRTLKAPGYLDQRAAAFDAEVATALASGDVAALAALDGELAAELGAGGRAAWQALAGAAGPAARSGELRARLLREEAPYGVGYFTALWQAGDAPGRPEGTD